MGLQNHPKVREVLGDELAKRLGYTGDPSVYEGNGVLLAIENDFVAALNSVNTCLLLCMEGMDENDLAWMLSAATGVDMDGDDLLKAGERIFNVEKAFNVREGMRRKDDTLPQKFFVEKDFASLTTRQRFVDRPVEGVIGTG